MPFCPDCGTQVSEDNRFCPDCGHRLAAGQDVRADITYSKALRWISGVLGFLSILAAIAGLEYFAESGLISELIVDIVSIAVGLVLLLMAMSPDWIRNTFKIQLEKSSVFGIAVVVLTLVVIVATGLGPEPPGGWWNW